MKMHILIMISLLISCNLLNQSGNLKNATDAEVCGKTADALALYVDALLGITPSAEILDVNKSKSIYPSSWKKEIEKHIIWLHTPAERLNKEYKDISEGVLRCSGKVHTENSIVNLKIKKYTLDQYTSDWAKLFFDPMVQVDPSCQIIAEKNYSDNFSIFRITAPQNYTYDISLINKATGKRIFFNLYPEASRSALLVPGDYLLICRSTISFTASQVWYSQYSVFQLNVPSEASNISVLLRTSVAKERKKE